MSALSVDAMNWVPLTVFLASLAGSAHCASMCGGLVIATAKTRASWVGYHLGRLAGYLSLGALGGLLGERILASPLASRWLPLISAMLLASAFFFAAFRIWFGRVPHLSLIPNQVLMRMYRGTQGNSFLTGLLTPLLPCGWLHTFALGAIATKSAAAGAAFLFMFWLGTLPALTTAPWLVRTAFRPLLRRAPRASALLLLCAGAFSIGSKLGPIVKVNPEAAATRTSTGTCHHPTR